MRTLKSPKKSEVQLGGRVNPFLIPLVVRKVFEYCDGKDLPNHRLVCKLWFSETLGNWRSRTTLNIHGDWNWKLLLDGSHASRRDDFRGGELLSLPMFLKLMRDDSLCFASIPFHHFRLQNWSFNNLTPTIRARDEENEERPLQMMLLEFWQNCGVWMKSVELVGCQCMNNTSNAGIHHFRDILFLHTPNIRELTIRHCRFEFIFPKAASLLTSSIHQYEHHQQINLTKLHISANIGVPCWPGFKWTEIFDFFPNLNSLEISPDRKHGAEEADGLESIDKLVTALVRLQERGIVCHLKHLDITNLVGDIDDYTAALFKRAHLQLETLKISLLADAEVVTAILELHAPTLRNLQLETWLVLNENLLGESPYTNLKELRVKESYRALQTFTFLHLTPALEVLHIHHGGSSVPRIGQDIPRLEGLVELHTDYKVESAEEFSRLTTRMPNMARLKLPLTPDTFAVMVAGWKDTLKELHIMPAHGRSFEIGDAEITGIPRKILESASSSSSSSVIDFDQVARAPNITNLTVLEKFSHDKVCRPLSKHSLIHGFSHLANFKSLHVYVENEIHPSTLLQTLEERVTDLRVVVTLVKPIMIVKRRQDSLLYTRLDDGLIWMIFVTCHNIFYHNGTQL